MGSPLLNNATYQEFLLEAKNFTVDLLSEYLEKETSGNDSCCEYESLKKNVHYIDSLSQGYSVPGTLIINGEVSVAELPYAAIDPATLADGMVVDIQIEYLDGSTASIANFTDNFLGSTLDDFFTAIAVEITGGTSGFTAICDTVNNLLIITSQPGSGANYATISIVVTPFFGIVNTVPFTDEIDTVNPEYIFAYGNKYAAFSNFPGRTFYIDHNNNIVTMSFNGVNQSLFTFTPFGFLGVQTSNSIVYNPTTDAVYFIDKSSANRIFITRKHGIPLFPIYNVALPQNISMLSQNFIYNPVDTHVYISDGSSGVFKIYSDDVAAPTIGFIDVSSISTGFLGNICVNEYTGDMILYPQLGNTGNTTVLRTDGTFSIATPFTTNLFHRVSFKKGTSNSDSYYIYSYYQGPIQVRRCDDLSLVFSSNAASSINGVWYSEVLDMLIGRDALNNCGYIYAYTIDIPNQTISQFGQPIDFQGIYTNGVSVVDQYPLEYDIPETGHVFVATQSLESLVDNNIYGVNIGIAFGSNIELDGFFRGGFDEIVAEDNCLTQSQADLIANSIDIA